jgi:hypothetical protein
MFLQTPFPSICLVTLLTLKVFHDDDDDAPAFVQVNIVVDLKDVQARMAKIFNDFL